MIRAEIGGRTPTVIWYIAPELMDHIPPKALENITSAPGFQTDLGHLPNGGLLLQFYASGCSIDEVGVMLADLSALYGVDARRLCN